MVAAAQRPRLDAPRGGKAHRPHPGVAQRPDHTDDRSLIRAARRGIVSQPTSAITRAISLRTIDNPTSAPMPGLASSWCAPHAIATWTLSAALRSVSAQVPPQYALTP